MKKKPTKYRYTYEQLEQALADGKKVQICSVDHKGKPTDWYDAPTINRSYDGTRYRIVGKQKRS